MNNKKIIYEYNEQELFKKIFSFSENYRSVIRRIVFVDEKPLKLLEIIIKYLLHSVKESPYNVEIIVKKWVILISYYYFKDRHKYSKTIDELEKLLSYEFTVNDLLTAKIQSDDIFGKVFNEDTKEINNHIMHLVRDLTLNMNSKNKISQIKNNKNAQIEIIGIVKEINNKGIIIEDNNESIFVKTTSKKIDLNELILVKGTIDKNCNDTIINCNELFTENSPKENNVYKNFGLINNIQRDINPYKVSSLLKKVNYFFNNHNGNIYNFKMEFSTNYEKNRSYDVIISQCLLDNYIIKFNIQIDEENFLNCLKNFEGDNLKDESKKRSLLALGYIVNDIIKNNNYNLQNKIEIMPLEKYQLYTMTQSSKLIKAKFLDQNGLVLKEELPYIIDFNFNFNQKNYNFSKNGLKEI